MHAAEQTRNELLIRAAKARVADKQLRALGIEDNECGRLADTLERLLANVEQLPAARLPWDGARKKSRRRA